MPTSIQSDQQSKDERFLNGLPKERREEARHNLVLLRSLQSKDEEGFAQEMKNYHQPKPS